MLDRSRSVRAKAQLVGLAESGGWKRYPLSTCTIWFCGYLYDQTDPRDVLGQWPVGAPDGEIARFLNRLDGHFGLICESAAGVVVAADPVRSVPIFFATIGGTTAIAANSQALLGAANPLPVDVDSALALAMAGYTIGTRTLYCGLSQLGPGEFLMIGAGSPRRVRYHRFLPWKVQDDSDEAFERQLADMTLSLIRRMALQTQDRLIAVPLSAGRDSRLIVSALAEVGARNVVCFSYGLPGNYEMVAGEKIARHLGFEWHAVPFTPASQRDFWNSRLNADYQEFADSNCSTTVVHDLPAIQALLERKIIDRRSVVVNGNSGDYITGLHIQPPIDQGLPDMAHEQRVDTVIATLIKKHFRLWPVLGTPDNDRVIDRQLRSEIAALELVEFSVDQAHGLYEYLEFQDRQSKYVISRQRIYEFLGLEWRLPLWSRAYLDFWQRVPLRLKRGQSLYARTLERRNWGGVWRGDEWTFARRVSPAWMRVAVRPLAMALCLPLGRSNWHRFERRYLSYWTDLFALQAIEPYWRVANDGRGARHAISWQTEAYLRRKGLDWDGRPK